MASTATKVFPFALRKQMLRGFAMQRVQFGKTAKKKFPAGLHRPNKKVARKCHCAERSYYANGSRQCNVEGNGTSREIFAILVFTLSLTLKIWNCFANGWRMAVRLRWNFKAKNVRERGYNYRRIKHDYAANKFILGAENAGKEFTTSHSILLMSRNAINFP